MSKATDDNDLSRSKLCEIAEIERGKHVRWTGSSGLLPHREMFGALDVVRAAMLNELNVLLKPAKAARVWRQIREDVGLPGTRLEVVIELATCRAEVVRTDEQLVAALGRREPLVVVPLHERANRALERLREYRSTAPDKPSVAVSAPDSSRRSSRTPADPSPR